MAEFFILYSPTLPLVPFSTTNWVEICTLADFMKKQNPTHEIFIMQSTSQIRIESTMVHNLIQDKSND